MQRRATSASGEATDWEFVRGLTCLLGLSSREGLRFVQSSVRTLLDLERRRKISISLFTWGWLGTSTHVTKLSLVEEVYGAH